MKAPYQPKTGVPRSCKRGIQRDNCPSCEGTGQQIDFKRIRQATSPEVSGPVAIINERALLTPAQLEQFIEKRFKNL